MRKIQTIIYVMALSLLSSTAFAHEGHDHAHWSSDALHILFYGSLLSVIAAISFFVIKQFKSKNSATKREEI